MFTVVIAQEEYIKNIQKYKLFLRPFMGSTSVVFCEWNISGTTFSEMVPDLSEIVSRRDEWRAVVVCDREGQLDTNPFNIVKYREPEKNDGESMDSYYGRLIKSKCDAYDKAMEKPLTRLMTYLCEMPGITENAITKMEDHYYNEDDMDSANAEVHEIDVFENNEFSRYKAEIKYKTALRKNLLKNESIRFAVPKEIYCIATRVKHDLEYDLHSTWETHDFLDYTRFYDWNMYFDKMRYLIYDILPTEHYNYTYDYLRFVSTVFVLANNDVPPDAIKPNYVYKIECKDDERALTRMAVSYDKKLENTKTEIEHKIAVIEGAGKKRLTDQEADNIFSGRVNINIPNFEGMEIHEIYGKKNQFGLSSDCPCSDTSFWASEFRRSIKTLKVFLKKPARYLKRTIEDLREVDNYPEENIKLLDEYQLSDITERVEDYENYMTSLDIPDIKNVGFYEQKLKDKNEDVKREMDKRMSKKVTIILGIVALVLLFISFISFIAKNEYRYVGSYGSVLAIVIGSIVLLAIVGFVCLIVLKLRFLSTVDEYNDEAKSIVDEIVYINGQRSIYLCDVCNAQRGYSVINYYNEREDRSTYAIRVLKRHIFDIEKTRAEFKDIYGAYMNDYSLANPLLVEPYTFDFSKVNHYEYPLPFEDFDIRQIDFVQSGNKAKVPIDFINSIKVEMEELYD